MAHEEVLICIRQLGIVSGKQEAVVVRTKEGAHRAHCCADWQKRQWSGQPLTTAISRRRGRTIQAEAIIQLMESQQSRPSPENPQQKPLLSQAGLMTLTKSQYQLKPKGQLGRQQGGRVLQQIDNDDQFAPLANITTSYLPLDSPLPPEPHPPHSPTPPPQYQKAPSQIRKTVQPALSHFETRRRDKVARVEGEDLSGIQEIIGDIQRVMEEAVADSRPKPSFKKDTQLVHHSRRHFQNKPASNFAANDSLFRLEEMLLNYQADSPITNHIPPVSPVEVTLRDTSRRPRGRRNDKEIPAQSKPNANVSRLQGKEGGIVGVVSKEKGRESGEGKGRVGVEDIEIMQLDWFKLPLLLGVLSEEGAQLAARMKDYPDHEQFWTAIHDSLPSHQQYNAYSIFNPSVEAGLKSPRTLMSQQEFREKWAEEWSQEIQEEEHKDLLCQLDFQWYRSLVQATYSHTLEDILVKDLPYDVQHFRQALRTISPTNSHKNPNNNDKNNSKNASALPLPQLATVNKLKYVEAFLDANKGKKTLVGVIPNIPLPSHHQYLNSTLKQAFIAQLFPADSTDTSMAVLLTRKQALACESGRWEEGRVRIGSIQVVVGEGKGGKGEGGECILVSRAKGKNSWIRLRVLRGGETNEVQVGEELYQGRRYHILLD